MRAGVGVRAVRNRPWGFRGAWLGALGLALLASGCREAETPQAGREIRVAQEPVIEVETARVRRGSILQRISAPGSLLARRESRIGPEVRGRIAEIMVEEGDRVAAGDGLFRIEPEPYQLALHQAQARLDRARAERAQVASDLARAEKLHRKAVMSETEMDQLRTSLDVGQAAVREAQEAVALAQRNLDQTLVRAPYDASVAARLEDEGTTALVQPQTIVVVLQETTELDAQATIPEVHFAAIREGDPALLHVEGLAHPIATEVSGVGDAVDPATRTFLVKMRLDNADHRLKAGVFARVEILPRAKSDVLLVPREAIRREDGTARVLSVREGRAVAVPVRLGAISEDAVEVLHGVRVDDLIVVGDHARTLGPGMRVATSTAGGPTPRRPLPPAPKSPWPREARRRLHPTPRLRRDADREVSWCWAWSRSRVSAIDLFPRVEFPVVTVHDLPARRGVARRPMEREVSQVLEESINTIEGIRTLRSAVERLPFPPLRRVRARVRHPGEGPGGPREAWPRCEPTCPTTIADPPVVGRVDPDASADPRRSCWPAP